MAEFTLCEETGVLALKGACVVHGGDACLKQFVPKVLDALCTTDGCGMRASAEVVLYECEDDPCRGHAYCRACTDTLAGGSQPSGFLGHPLAAMEDQ